MLGFKLRSVCLTPKPVFFTLNILFNNHNPQVVRSVPNQSHFPSEKREVMICFTSQSELVGAKITHIFPLSTRYFSSKQSSHVTLIAVMQNLWVSIKCSWFLRIFNITTKVASPELRSGTFLSIPGHLGITCQVQFLYLSQNPVMNPMSNDANNLKAQAPLTRRVLDCPDTITRQSAGLCEEGWHHLLWVFPLFVKL